MAKKTKLPKSQYAVQLTGPSQLTLNTQKAVPAPGPRQILCKVEAVGLCFSDLKLLKQFTEHPRKSEVVKGVDPQALAEIPSYVPGEKPTVPGHEAVVRIVAVGKDVSRHKIGERCLVQADFREVRTAGSNGAFGYNFEGALQEYVLLDERVVIEPSTGERYLIPAQEETSASAVCLSEPWACVEDSYVTVERQSLLPGGKLLVVAAAGHAVAGLGESLSPQGKPASVTLICSDDTQRQAAKALGVAVAELPAVAALGDALFDDIVYFGADKATIEALNDRLAGRAIINIVTGGKKIGAPVSVGVGRVHYGLIRWIGTAAANADDSYKTIPATGEIRDGDTVCIVGAGGPMGTMHVIRDICTGAKNVSVIGTDMDDNRLAALTAKAGPLARKNNVSLRMVNTQKTPLAEKFSYIALMAPVGALVAGAIANSRGGCLINIFAGIPAPTRHELDLDAYIANRCFMFGTSGSTIRDMKIVLAKVESGQLDTNLSVDAISGMAGAIDGIAAVENRTLAGKIIVYPMLHDLPLVPLNQLAQKLPAVAAKLNAGLWTRDAEQELLAKKRL